MNRSLSGFVLLAGLIALACPAWSQSTWEGPTGVFLNPLALVAKDGTSSATFHYLSLQPVGSLTTAGYVYSGGTWEAGYTHADLAIGGGSGNIDILHGKWIAIPFKGEAPQVALGAILRHTEGGDDTSDFYAVATKIFPAKTPVIASLTVRNTDGAWSGLFGKGASRKTVLGGFLGVQVTPKFITGIEYYGQPDSVPWRDIAVRYVVGPSTFLDAGVARLNSTFDNQIAVAITHQW